MSPTAVASEYDRFTESSIVRDIPLSLLAPSPTNPRKHFEPEPLQELASDIRARGILAPLRVRPRGEAFEIVFGERRFRAAQIATLSAAPCIIGDLSDLEVLELQIAENLQRADMTPIEESDAFARLQAMDPKYREVKALAAQVGKSVTTVRELLRLQALVPAVREALDAGDITVGHARLIARVAPGGQAAALKECFYPLYGAEKGEREVKPLKDFERWFNDNVVLDVEHETVAETFPELAGAVAKAAGELVRLTTYGAGAPKPRKGEPPVLTPGQFREAKAKDACGVTGVYVLGRGRGSIVRVCVDQTCTKHWPKRETVTRHRTAGSSAPKESAEAKRKRLAKEATARRSLELAQARRETVEERALDEFIERAGTLQTRDLLLRGVVCELLRGDVNFETFNERFGVKASYQSKPADLKKLVGDTLLQALAFCVGDQDLQHAYGDWKRAELMKAFGVDLARIDKEVAEEQASQEALANSDAPSAKKKSAGKAKPAAAKRAKKR